MKVALSWCTMLFVTSCWVSFNIFLLSLEEVVCLRWGHKIKYIHKDASIKLKCCGLTYQKMLILVFGNIQRLSKKKKGKKKVLQNFLPCLLIWNLPSKIYFLLYQTQKMIV